uniref:Basement membrane-specific heparan sulfate proteoglycan core protein n=1 Tax=Parastrongyloides trichosuri TaxID=131310 RepID=A0A0N4ZW82_PARTI
MAILASAATLLTAISMIYRITLNLPDVSYHTDLRNPKSQQYQELSNDIEKTTFVMLSMVTDIQNVSVKLFRYHQVIGTLVTFDIKSDVENEKDIRNFFETAVEHGRLGNLVLSSEGFEIVSFEDEIVSQCHPSQFACQSSVICIDRVKVCNQIADCSDGSDESSEHGRCDSNKPYLSTEQKYVDILVGKLIELHVSVNRTPSSYEVSWLKDGYDIEESDRIYKDKQTSHHHTQKDYTLRIEGAAYGDSGLYKFVLTYNGESVEVEIPVRIYGFEHSNQNVPKRENILNDNFKQCPEGEKACKSGHCLSEVFFCDRQINCPDGDDEANCGEVVCNSNEFSCDNICIGKDNVCDGIPSCLDGKDEANCPGFGKQRSQSNIKPTSSQKNTHHAQITVTCPDGSIPEYSLHGSTYCWSNSVCPSGTLCTDGKCCHNANADALRHCDFDQWECNDGECLDWSNRCNQVVECADKSDEMHCHIIIAQPQNGKRSVHKKTNNTTSNISSNSVCRDDEYECNNKQCISLDKKCNRNYDCSDGSDETKCEYFINAQRYHSQKSNNNQHSQESVYTEPFEIITHQTNDFSRDTKQSSEEQCADDEYKCLGLDYLYCIHYDKICDGIDDCGNNSDESKCTKSLENEVEVDKRKEGECNVGEFKCNNNQCISSSLQCNRRYDCEDGSDETTCEYFIQAAQRHHQQTTTTTTTTTTSTTTQSPIVEQPRHPAISQQVYEEQERLRLHQEAEYQRRLEEYHRSHQQQHKPQETIQTPKPLPEVTFKDEYDREVNNELPLPDEDFETEDIGSCQHNEFMCQHSRECIDKKAYCDGVSDCLDQSDEIDCQDKGNKFTTIHSKTDGRHDEHKEEEHDIHKHITDPRYHQEEPERHPAQPPQRPHISNQHTHHNQHDKAHHSAAEQG